MSESNKDWASSISAFPLRPTQPAAPVMNDEFIDLNRHFVSIPAELELKMAIKPSAGHPANDIERPSYVYAGPG